MFERCLYFNINALSRAINRIWDQAFAEFQLSPSHAYLLRLVLASPGLSPKQLSGELKLEKSTVTRFLHVLEQKGLIKRKQGTGSDGREQGIYPGAKAIKIAARLEAKSDALYTKMSSLLGKRELVSLVAQLRQLETRLK
jgi:DNA-binding MarR family transcriptional regulator